MPSLFYPMRFDAVAVSCEHASNRIPARYQAYFRRARAALDSHRGWDIDALSVARAIARRCRAPIFAANASRLLIDLNRSPHHRALFSQWSRPLPSDARAAIVEGYYQPYRDRVEAHLRACLDRGESVLLLSVHSFTPIWEGVERTADIGFLYDPRRRGERILCAQWKDALAVAAPALRVRRNYPYRGTNDGFSVALRRSLRSARFACVELEFNQALLSRGNSATIAGVVAAALDRARNVAAPAALDAEVGVEPGAHGSTSPPHQR